MVNVRQFIREDAGFGRGDLKGLEPILAGPQLGEVRQEITALQAEIGDGEGADENQLLRAGIGSYVLGQHQRAIGYLSRLPDSPPATFYRALSLSSLGRH